jgi:hypothetical protein
MNFQLFPAFDANAGDGETGRKEAGKTRFAAIALWESLEIRLCRTGPGVLL